MINKKHSIETKKKISTTLKLQYKNSREAWNKGKERSLETKKKISLSKKGQKSYWKGKHNPYMVGNNFMKGKTAWNKNKNHPSYKKFVEMLIKRNKKRIGEPSWNKGIEYPQIRGEKNGNWKGGITPLNKRIRGSLNYKKWRISVFERDNYTCQECGERGCELNADHIRPFALIIQGIKDKNGEVIYAQIAQYEELWDLDNGRTLCVNCHRKTYSYKKQKLIIENGK